MKLERLSCGKLEVSGTGVMNDYSVGFDIFLFEKKNDVFGW